jgi:hypothetical protein
VPQPVQELQPVRWWRRRPARPAGFSLRRGGLLVAGRQAQRGDGRKQRSVDQTHWNLWMMPAVISGQPDHAAAGDADAGIAGGLAAIVVGVGMHDQCTSGDIGGGASAKGNALEVDIDVGAALGVGTQVVHVAQVVLAGAGAAMRSATGVGGCRRCWHPPRCSRRARGWEAGLLHRLQATDQAGDVDAAGSTISAMRPLTMLAEAGDRLASPCLLR